MTQLSEEGLAYRGHPVESLIDEPFERVAELLWTGALPTAVPRWSADSVCDSFQVESVERSPDVIDLIELATHLTRSASDVSTPEFAARLLAAIPVHCGVSSTRVGAKRDADYAYRVARIWT